MTEPYRPAIIGKNKREEKHGSVCFRNDGVAAGAFSRHKGEWSPMESEYGKDFLLYMVEEIGEVIAIYKRRGVLPLRKIPQYGRLSLEKWQMFLCTTTMFFCDTM